jgi:hypothetical protein
MTELQLAICILGLITGAELRVRRLVKIYLKELIPNSGSSMKDKIDKLSERQDHIDQKLDTLINTLLAKK